LRNDFVKISTGCARACFKDRKSTSGLSILEIETQAGYRDHDQAFTAGLLEGTLTWMNIYAQWKNTIESFCEKDDKNQKFCDWIRDTVTVNFRNVMKLAEERPKNDHYLHQIYLFYKQMLGVESGFKRGVKRARKDFELDFTDFLLLNLRVDLDDLKTYYNEFILDDEEDKLTINPVVGKMVLKIVIDENSHPKLLFAHSADGDYAEMLKIIKTYRFNYHHTAEANRLVVNTDITFTSSPGAIASSDDFYIAMGKHSRVIVAGVALKHHISSARNLHGSDLEGTIFSSARIMAANRLSHNGKHWSHLMARDPEIGASQWIIVDEKRLKFVGMKSSMTDSQETVVTSSANSMNEHANNIPSDDVLIDLSQKSIPSSSNRNIIWLADQTFKLLHAEDMSSKFNSEIDELFLSGVPYFKKTQELNDVQPKPQKSKNMTTIEDVIAFFKSSSYRGDLELENPKPYGNIDLKVYTSQDHKLTVQSGPISPNGTMPFNWNSEHFNDIRHDEHPALWDFSPVLVNYFWN
jgi:Phospholipase B